MHEHNNNDNKNDGHKGMMWMMVMCCLLSVVILLGGTSFFKSIGYGWLGIVLIGGFIVFHLRHIFRPHGNNKSDKEVKDADSTNHKDCCH